MFAFIILVTVIVTFVHRSVRIAVPQETCVEYKGVPMILHDGMKYQMSISGCSKAVLLHKQKQQVLVIDSIKPSEQEALEYMISLQTSKFPLQAVCVSKVCFMFCPMLVAHKLLLQRPLSGATSCAIFESTSHRPL